MSANPLDFFTAYAGVPSAREAAGSLPSERRKRTRIRLHWPVLIFRNQVPEAITSTTQNLSSGGFYCLTGVPLVHGEILICTLRIPFHDPNGKHLDRNLECKVRVVRVDRLGTENSFGVACHIEDYHFADLLRGC
jgi:hypothetical protein